MLSTQKALLFLYAINHGSPSKKEYLRWRVHINGCQNIDVINRVILLLKK